MRPSEIIFEVTESSEGGFEASALGFSIFTEAESWDQLKAEIADADAFFAVTRGDNTNLMAAQIVQKKYETPKVCVKVADPLRAEAYRKLGLFCINASSLLAGLCRDWLLEEEYATIDSYNVLPKEIEF